MATAAGLVSPARPSATVRRMRWRPPAFALTLALALLAAFLLLRRAPPPAPESAPSDGPPHATDAAPAQMPR